MKSKTAKRPIEILIVDDNPGDVRLTLEALKDGKVQNRLHTAHDGVEAIAFLRRKGEYADAPLPDLILLDLNMPRMNGVQLLAEVRRLGAETHPGSHTYRLKRNRGHCQDQQHAGGSLCHQANRPGTVH